MKKFIYILAIVIFQLDGYSQVENEILSFTDSTEIIVNNGRKLLIQSILQDNIEKSNEIYDYLNKITKNKGYSAFYYYEEMLLNILLSNWSVWFEKAQNYSEYRRQISYQNSYRITPTLFEKVSQKIDSLIDQSQLLPLNEEDKSVLLIYLTYLKSGENSSKYIELVRNYNKVYEGTIYSEFINDFMPKAPVVASWSFSVGPELVVPTSKFGNFYPSQIGGFMSMDLKIERFYGSLYFDATVFSLKQSFSSISATDTLEFMEGDDFSYIRGGLHLGFLIRKKNFHFAPYLNFSGGSFESNKFPPEESDKEFEVFNTFIYGAGMHIEIKIHEFKIKNAYGFSYSKRTNSFISLKAEGSFDRLAKINYDMFKGTIPTFRLGIVWGFGQF